MNQRAVSPSKPFTRRGESMDGSPSLVSRVGSDGTRLGEGREGKTFVGLLLLKAIGTGTGRKGGLNLACYRDKAGEN